MTGEILCQHGTRGAWHAPKQGGALNWLDLNAHIVSTSSNKICHINTITGF